MSASPNARPMTIEEFERLPDKDGIQELLDGEVVEMAPPKLRHTCIVQNVEAVFLRYLHRRRVFTEAGFLMGRRHCLQPDVAVIHPGQMIERGWYAGAPVIAVEVASRGNTPDELELKKDLYLAKGATEVWMVYDKTRSVMVHTEAGASRYKDRFRSAALDAEIDVSEIFRD